MQKPIHQTSRTCATWFSTSQVQEIAFKLHQKDNDFEVKQSICGQDFIADICGCVNVTTPVITYLVDLQGVQVPIWKAAVWYPKVSTDKKNLEKLSIDNPPDTCVDLKSNNDDIKEFIFHKQELVECWLVVVSDVCHVTGEERFEILMWNMRQLEDVQNDLQQLVKDLFASLESCHNKCLSSLQHTLTCMDMDTLVNLLVGKRNKACGYLSLTHEDDFVEYGKREFKKFYNYVCSLDHVKELVENHFTELKLRTVYSDEILVKLKNNTLKIILWTPLHLQILSS
ncbi:Hypothetical predicted protein [Paramuricea clavata]|uniref:Uncharacterized protein n=1 Tax=Paramuricea clavata TaxID=317549 RepID=A0A6S7J4I0_PARCT|nr:Hypothetical predicted protein [Paramuricea clavata]